MAGTPPFPGMPGMDMNALQALMDDPQIRAMTEALTQDPAFVQMAAAMQEQMLAGGLGDLSLGEGAGAGGMPDPSQYMDAFSKMMQNPQFMSAAEQLGKGLMESGMDSESLAMMKLFQDPANADKLKAKMEELKDDANLGPMIRDIEENGQAAMMKYMNDAELMSKMGKKFQEAMEDESFVSGLVKPDDAEEEEEEGEEPGKETTIISAASNGSVDRLKELLADGADVNEADEEGRTALHWSAGYSEIECMKALIEAKCDINAVDENSNTALSYAAGYGNEDAVKLLLDHKADVLVKNAEGKTAKDVAEMNDQDAIVKMLS
jgi:hypothetical protein